MKPAARSAIWWLLVFPILSILLVGGIERAAESFGIAPWGEADVELPWGAQN